MENPAESTKDTAEGAQESRGSEWIPTPLQRMVYFPEPKYDSAKFPDISEENFTTEHEEFLGLLKAFDTEEDREDVVASRLCYAIWCDKVRRMLIVPQQR